MRRVLKKSASFENSNSDGKSLYSYEDAIPDVGSLALSVLPHAAFKTFWRKSQHPVWHLNIPGTKVKATE